MRSGRWRGWGGGKINFPSDLILGQYTYGKREREGEKERNRERKREREWIPDLTLCLCVEPRPIVLWYLPLSLFFVCRDSFSRRKFKFKYKYGFSSVNFVWVVSVAYLLQDTNILAKSYVNKHRYEVHTWMCKDVRGCRENDNIFTTCEPTSAKSLVVQWIGCWPRVSMVTDSPPERSKLYLFFMPIFFY